MSIDININGMTDSSNQLYDGLNHIDIYIEGLKNIPATFLKLTDTPDTFNEGMFLQSAKDSIIYVDVPWESMQDDIRKLTSDLSDARNNIQTLFDNFTIMESNIALIENRDIRGIERRLDTDENTILSIQQDLDTENTGIKSRLTQAEQDISTLKEDVVSLKQNINDLNTSINGGSALEETPSSYNLE